MRKSYAAALLLIVIAAISAPAAAQGITGPSQSFYNADPITFVDSLTVTDINNTQDFLVFVILPLIGVYGLMWFLFSKVLQMAENNFADNDTPTSDDLSAMGQKAAVLMAAAVAVVTVMRYGNFSPLVTLLLFLLALYMLYKNGLGFVGVGGGTDGDGGERGPRGPEGPQGPPGNSPDLPDNLVTSDDLPDDLGGGGSGGSNNVTAPPGGGQSSSPYQNVDLDIDSSSMQEMAAMMQQILRNQPMQETPAMMQMMALFQGRMAPGNGGVVVQPPNGPNAVIPPQQVNQLMQMMQQVMSEGDEDFDMEVVNQLLGILDSEGGELNAEIVNELEQFLQQIHEGADPDEIGPVGADIKIEELELVAMDSHQPFPRVRKDGGYVHVVPAGATTDQIGIHAMVSCNKKAGLQQITFNFDDNQRDLGLNSSSFGHDESDVIPLSDLVGGHTFKEGQMHNFGVNAIGQMGNNENTIAQIEVWAPMDTPEGTPELPPGDPELESGPNMPPLPEGKGSDPSKIIDEIDDIIGDLEGELDIEEVVISEKKDAENKLAEALEELVNYRDILHALIYFREVDFDASHADIHQQVEKILSKVNGVGSADQLQKEIKNIQQVFGRVEKALEELEDAYEKMADSAGRQQDNRSELQDISDTVNELSRGAGNIMKYIDEYYNN